MAQAPDPLRDGILWIAEDFSQIVRNALPEEFGAPTESTRWTNRQLLFHLVLGQNIARAAIPLFGFFSHLPPAASRAWSRLLEACTGPYNWVNWPGSAAAGQLLTPAAMARMMERTTRAIVVWYDRADEAALERGMSVPPSWDPYFTPWMSRREILSWAPQHYRHHRDQLTLTTIGQPGPGRGPVEPLSWFPLFLFRLRHACQEGESRDQDQQADAQPDALPACCGHGQRVIFANPGPLAPDPIEADTGYCFAPAPRRTNTVVSRPANFPRVPWPRSCCRVRRPCSAGSRREAIPRGAGIFRP